MYTRNLTIPTLVSMLNWNCDCFSMSYPPLRQNIFQLWKTSTYQSPGRVNTQHTCRPQFFFFLYYWEHRCVVDSCAHTRFTYSSLHSSRHDTSQEFFRLVYCTCTSSAPAIEMHSAWVLETVLVQMEYPRSVQVLQEMPRVCPRVCYITVM